LIQRGDRGNCGSRELLQESKLLCHASVQLIALLLHLQQPRVPLMRLRSKTTTKWGQFSTGRPFATMGLDQQTNLG
jgi:hypothetical protein